MSSKKRCLYSKSIKVYLEDYAWLKEIEIYSEKKRKIESFGGKIRHLIKFYELNKKYEKK